MKERHLAWVGRIALVAIALGALVALSVLLLGWAPIRASSGHWALTRWALVAIKHRSIASQAADKPSVELDDPGLLTLGAGHYDTGCRSCHGAPGEPRPLVPAQALPAPPELVEVAQHYEPEELFFVIRHGIKFTGMPAWPAPERPDEVWAVVAFVEDLPQLDARAYASLVRGDSRPAGDAPPAWVRQACAGCHGPTGHGRAGEHAPVLSGQKVDYLAASLGAYARGQRASGIMQPVAARLSEAQRQQAAQWFASQPPPSIDPARPRDATGEQIVEAGIFDRKVPSCSDCHAPGASPHYPTLDGQKSGSLRRQLELFGTSRRGGSDYARLMSKVAVHALTEREVDAVARYYAAH